MTPSTPDIYLPCEDCEKVADLARWHVRTVTWIDQDEQFRAAVNAVRSQLDRGEWRDWSDLRKETAVAVAQRVAAALLWRVKEGAR